MGPFPTARCRQPEAWLRLRRTLPALRLLAPLLQPRSSSLCLQPKPLATLEQKMCRARHSLHLAPGFHRKPPNFPLLQRSRFCTKSRFSREHQNPTPARSPGWARIAALFVLYTPKQAWAAFALPLLSTCHPMSPPKGDREEKGLLLLPEAHAMAVPRGACLSQRVWVPRTAKPPCAPTDTPATAQRTRECLWAGGVPEPCSPPAAAQLPPGPAYLNGLVEDAVPDLDHLQVLLLLIPRTFDVGHPAAVVLLAGIDEVPHRAVFVEDLGGGESGW